jgi:riboflavin biosynthesis pyrimidine reductase
MRLQRYAEYAVIALIAMASAIAIGCATCAAEDPRVPAREPSRSPGD